MACRLFGAKPLPEPMPTSCQLDTYEQNSVKFESKFKVFHSQNVFENIVGQMKAILSRGDELITKDLVFNQEY